MRVVVQKLFRFFRDVQRRSEMFGGVQRCSIIQLLTPLMLISRRGDGEAIDIKLGLVLGMLKEYGTKLQN
jgi:hypothetical protein